MRVIATSDLHGNLPEIEPCDVLIIAGDHFPLKVDRDYALSMAWAEKYFIPWLEDDY